MPKLEQILKRSSGSRQACVSVFFFSDHCIKQIDSNRTNRFFGKNNSDTLACSSCATSLFLRHFDAICDLLLNRPTATWNLFVKLIKIITTITILIKNVNENVNINAINVDVDVNVKVNLNDNDTDKYTDNVTNSGLYNDVNFTCAVIGRCP